MFRNSRLSSRSGNRVLKKELIILLPRTKGGGYIYAINFIKTLHKLAKKGLISGSVTPHVLAESETETKETTLINLVSRKVMLIYQFLRIVGTTSKHNKSSKPEIVVFVPFEYPYIVQSILPLIKLIKRNIKLGIKIHSSVPLYSMRSLIRYFGRFALLAFLGMKLFLFALNFYDVLMFPCKYTANNYYSKGLLSPLRRRRRFVISGGALDLDYILSIEPNYGVEYDAVFLSSKITIKDIISILAAWKRVTTRLHNVKLMIAGVFSGPTLLKKKLRTITDKIIEEFGLQGKVEIFNSGERFLERKKFISLMIPKKLLVYSSYEDSWPLVIGEALARGLIVIVMEHPAIREVFGSCPSVITCKTPDQMSNAVLELLTVNKERRENLSKIAVDWASKFSYERLVTYEIKSLTSN